jgi:hypothetical protein
MTPGLTKTEARPSLSVMPRGTGAIGTLYRWGGQSRPIQIPTGQPKRRVSKISARKLTKPNRSKRTEEGLTEAISP